MRKSWIAALLVWLAIPSMVLAGDTLGFDAARFSQMQSENRPFVVAVHASWCPTCKAQKPILAGLMADPAFADYTLFTVDFDQDAAVLHQFKVTKQSTILVYRGATEVGRSIGDTQPASIRELLLKARL